MNRCIVVASALVLYLNTSFIPAKAQEPQAPPTGKKVLDLLPLVEPARDGLIGAWAKKGDLLVSPSLPHSILALARELLEKGEKDVVLQYFERRARTSHAKAEAREGLRRTSAWRTGAGRLKGEA
jgi:hypothetical protein